MIDSDHFKLYNDTFGHQAGDKLLMQIGEAIAGSLKRPGDLGARYGGDEFAVLLPGSRVEEARRMAQQIRHAFVTACYAEGISGKYSRLSIGVASLVPARRRAYARPDHGGRRSALPRQGARPQPHRAANAAGRRCRRRLTRMKRAQCNRQRMR